MSDFDEVEFTPADSEGGEEQKKPDVRFTPFTEANRDLEVVVSDDPLDEELIEEGPSREEIEAELAKTKAELQAAQQGGATADAVRQLAEHLKPQQQSPAIPMFLQQAQQEAEFGDEEAKALAEMAYEGEGGKGFLTALDKYNAKKLLPAKAKAVMDKLYFGQKFIESDQSKKEFHTKYRTEIQNIINQTPLDRLYGLQDPYLEAYNYVLSQHQDEVMQTTMQAQIAEGVRAELERRGIKAESNKPNTGTQTFTEGGLRPGPKEGTTGAASRRVRLNSIEEADRLRKNMTPGTYAAFLARNPKYRKALNERQ